MREKFEFRVDREHFEDVFRPDEGRDIGSSIVRLIEVEGDDPRLVKIGEMQREIDEENGEAFFYGWRIHREYTPEEIESADLFRFEVRSFFEPAGEECGTEYDESTACSECGSGAVQVGPLILAGSRIPRGKDITETIAGEIIVSSRIATLFGRNKVTGIHLEPVRVNRGRQISEDWYQLRIPASEAELVPPTRVGINPFDEDPEGRLRCSRGDLIGLNLLSEVSIAKDSRGETDFVASKQYIGTRRGLLRPRRVILISPRIRQLLVDADVKAFETDIAHLV
jgi:hypothetical protein